MVVRTVTVSSEVRHYVEAFHEADAKDRIDRIVETLRYLGNTGRDVDAVQAVLAECVRRKHADRVGQLQRSSARHRLAVRDRAARDLQRALASSREWFDGWHDEHAALRAMEKLLKELAVSPFIEPDGAPVDVDVRRPRAGRPWVHKQYEAALKKLRVPPDERKELLEAIGMIL